MPRTRTAEQLEQMRKYVRYLEDQIVIEMDKLDDMKEILRRGRIEVRQYAFHLAHQGDADAEG